MSSKSSWEQSIERLDKSHKTEVPESKLRSAAAKFSMKGGVSATASKERKGGLVEKVGQLRSDYGKRYVKFDDNDEEGVDDEMEEEMDDPRWYNIKNKFKGMVGAKVGKAIYDQVNLQQALLEKVSIWFTHEIRYIS